MFTEECGVFIHHGRVSGSRVSGSHMTLKTLELFGLAQSFSNFSDFEFLTGQHFSDFGSRIMLRNRSNPTSRHRKSKAGLRGLSGPAGGADFFGFASQNRDFLTIND